MKRSLAFSLLSAFLTKFSVASPEAAIDDIWATDPISPNTYSDFDPASTPYDETQGSVLDENLITDPESYTGSLADGNTGCSGNIEPSAKRRREDSCVPGADIHLALPQSPFETLEQKNRINLDLDPIRFPGVPPQFTQMDSIYCGNEKFVVCDSARENDKQSNGDGKYRLLNARRVTQGSLCVSPYSIWCCEMFSPKPPGDAHQDLNGAQQDHDALDGDSVSTDFGLPDTTVQEGDVADLCTYFVTLP